MSDLSLHLAPNAPWIALALVTLVFGALALWAYAISIPPLPALARRLLPALRGLALVVLLWLLAQPVLERVRAGDSRVAVLVDHSTSMDLPVAPGGERRADAAERVAGELARAWRGRARVDVLPFAAGLGTDAGGGRSSTAIGEALAALGQRPEADRTSAVVVVSDGVVNAGRDPVAAAQALGLPVHAVQVGAAGLDDRAVAGVETSTEARVGRTTPVRVRVWSTEPRGTPIGVSLADGARTLGRATVFAPGSGAEVTADFQVTPSSPGLAVWTARVDSLAGETARANNARQVAVEVAPGRIEVLILSAGLNWDLTFVRRALAGDSGLAVSTWVRERNDWRSLDTRRAVPANREALRGAAVVVLDGVGPEMLPGSLDQALAGFLREGGAVLAFGGPSPGLLRFRSGALGAELAPTPDPRPTLRAAAPAPVPEASEILAWDDDPARGARAWRAAAPLSDVMPIALGAGDRALVRGQSGEAPLLYVRRVGRGQALLVNGTSVWRWSLSGLDDLAQERGRRLWRGLARWLSQPVQSEPLRVRPERWLADGGEAVRLFATVQDDAFKPLADATVEGEVADGAGHARPITFEPRAPGSYVATVPGLAPGRYQVNARASRGGAALGRARTEFAIDRWSLEDARTLPDSSTLAAIAEASGGRAVSAAGAAAWARGLETRALAGGRTESSRLWESPWTFALVVGALSLEWAWRRKRGLP